MKLSQCSMPVLPAGKSFEQAYSLICFSRFNEIRHADALASFKCMAKHYPDVWTHVEKVVASNVTGGAPYASLLMDASACALFMAWRRDDFSHLGCYAADGPFFVRDNKRLLDPKRNESGVLSICDDKKSFRLDSGEALPVRFVNWMGEEFNAWRSRHEEV